MRKPKIVEPKLTDNAMVIAKKRYLRTDMKGRVVETPGEMLWRVAQHMATAEAKWGANGAIMEIATKFYSRMTSMKMVSAGKAMFEAGNPGGTGQLSSCFVLPIEDSIEKIFKTLGDAAVVHKNNGGTGFNFSAIRPHGDKVRNVPGAASGPVDFLKVYSVALSQILQGAKRQGANIGILNVDHPDIEEFIDLKDTDGELKNFNVSVGVTDEFMKAIESDERWELRNPRTGEVVGQISAVKLFDKITNQAWKTGDPGFAFLDTMERGNTVPNYGVLDATNPCGEIALFPYESCNLTSIDLARHMKKSKKSYVIDWGDLEESVRLGVRFLDNMIEVNTYPIPEIEQAVREGNRRIGLGVMGFAHVLYRMRIPYDSKEAVSVAKKLSKFIYERASSESEKLARVRGNFANWDLSIYSGMDQPMRNCAVTMIAPTGTTSMLANTSSGIEPVFSLVTVRRSFYEDDPENRSTKEFIVVDPEFERYLRNKYRASKSKYRAVLGRLKAGDYGDLSEDERKIFVTTHDIDPRWHVEIQAAWQKYFDNSISKTINFSHDATVEDVKRAYMLAWKKGCKGITIYRDGSKNDQVLRSSGKIGDFAVDCPECGGKLFKTEGCSKCHKCGWAVCE